MAIELTNLVNETVDVTIANGATVSSAATLYGSRLVGIITPSALTGVAFTFQASADGSTFTAVYDTNGAAISATVSTDQWVVLDPADFAGIPYLKVVSGAAEGAGRTISLVVRPV